ncbi:MAG: hypothetical protein ACK5NN_08180 [Sphingomonadaceae bacterium]
MTERTIPFAAGNFRFDGPSVSRRAILRSAGAIVTMAVATPALAEHAITAKNGIRYVVTDNRLRPSMTFAACLQSGGSEPLEVTEGLTALWSQVLVPHWEAPKGAVAGLTSVGVWEGLSQQAQLQFRRAHILGTHSFDHADRAIGHMLTQVQTETDAVSALTSGLLDIDWPLILAQNAEKCLHLKPAGRKTCRIGSSSQYALGTRHLVSWIIE